MKRTIAFCLVTIFVVLSPALVMAQDGGKYTRLPVGTKAPFSGFLVDDIAFANILSRAEAEKKVCKALLGQQSEICTVQIDKEKKLCKVTVDAQKKRHEQIIKIKNEQLAKYEEIVVERKKGFFERFKETSFWTGLGIGLAVGSVTTLAVALSR